MSSPFPDPTGEEHRRMRRMARRVAWKYGAFCGDERALAEDLEQAGWEGFYRAYGSQYVWASVRHAMTDCWVRWRFGVAKRNHQEKRAMRIYIPLSYDEAIGTKLAALDVTPDDRLMLQECVARIYAGLDDPHCRTIDRAFRAIMLDGTSVSKATRERCGIPSPSHLQFQRGIIRQWAKQAIAECAPDWCHSYISFS